MATPDIPNFLQLPTQALLDEFGAGRHKPGSGSAAALLGLVGCKMMQTVVTVTLRNPRYSANFSQLEFVGSVLTERHEPFFREAVQRDSVQFDRYHQARLARNACADPDEKRRLSDHAREELIPATNIPLEIAQHALDTGERGMLVYDLGARHTRGDSGVAVSAALSSCSGALFVVYLNLLEFREGHWATSVRNTADSIAERYQTLQSEQFRRVSRIQAEGIADTQLELGIPFQPPDDDAIS
jgi:formiminotetrahydrofolate cyclodeaminase